MALEQKRCLRCLQASTYASSLLTGAGLGSSLTAPQPPGSVPATFNASSAGASYLTQQRPTLVLLGPSSVTLLQGGPVWDRCWPRLLFESVPGCVTYIHIYIYIYTHNNNVLVRPQKVSTPHLLSLPSTPDTAEWVAAPLSCGTPVAPQACCGARRCPATAGINVLCDHGCVATDPADGILTSSVTVCGQSFLQAWLRCARGCGHVSLTQPRPAALQSPTSPPTSLVPVGLACGVDGTQPGTYVLR